MHTLFILRTSKKLLRTCIYRQPHKVNVKRNVMHTCINTHAHSHLYTRIHNSFTQTKHTRLQILVIIYLISDGFISTFVDEQSQQHAYRPAANTTPRYGINLFPVLPTVCLHTVTMDEIENKYSTCIQYSSGESGMTLRVIEYRNIDERSSHSLL